MPAGSNKMKNKIYIVTFILLLSNSFNLFAANAANNKNVDVKCHAELYGGQETIYFATVKENAVNQLANRLKNRKVPTVYSKEKQQIYRVFECVKLTDSFRSVQARNLFAKYPR